MLNKCTEYVSCSATESRRHETASIGSESALATKWSEGLEAMCLHALCGVVNHGVSGSLRHQMISKVPHHLEVAIHVKLIHDI